MSFNQQEFWQRGFCKLSENISKTQLLALNTLLQTQSIIDRGHDNNGKYYAKAPNRHVRWANWWSQDTNNYQAVFETVKFYLPQVALLLDDPMLYHSDFVVTTPDHRGVRPHIDTPYRFESFENEERLLAVQCLLPLSTFDINTGGTAFVPGSHNHKWNISECYRGVHNDYFMENCHQPELQPGEMVIWHPRVLHSAMPNNGASKRSALLILFVEREYYDEIRVIDNIFT